MLTDTACRHAVCPEGKNRGRFADSGGLYLEVAPNGSKRWFWKYRFEAKEKRLALGSYPDKSLKSARADRDEAKKTQQAGVDPAQKRVVEELAGKSTAASRFEAVAREFHGTKARAGWSATHAQQWLRSCEKDLFPYSGSLAAGDV